MGVRDGAQELLLLAIRSGDLERIEALLDAGTVDLETLHKDWTPLVYATSRNEPSAVALLLKRGAAVDGVDAFGETPLRLAARKGHVAVMRVLLSYNASLEATCPEGFTALLDAANNKQVESVRLLLDAGADVNAFTPLLQNTALHLVANYKNAALARLLLDAGADANARGYYKPLHRGALATRNELRLVKLLEHCQKSNTLAERLACVADPPFPPDVTPLHIAAFNGDVATAQLLVEHGASLEARIAEVGFTPLIIADMTDDVEMTQILLALGANDERQAASLLFASASEDAAFVLAASVVLAVLLFVCVWGDR